MVISNELTNRLLDAAPDATVMVDDHGTIVYANSRVKEVLGYAREELVGGPLEALLPERYRAMHPQHQATFAASPNPRPMGAGLELYALHKDGHEFPVEISLSPVTTEAGLLISSAIRDVSEQKKLERELKEANRAKSRFLAAASHDLRQPMQTLNLLNRAAKSITTDQNHHAIIEKQQKSLDSMSRLLNSLLNISKLEAGVVRPDISDYAIQAIFDDLRAEFEAQAQDKGLELIIDRCEDVVHTDPVLLCEILENLISNAIRYTRKGFVHLRCFHRKLSIRLEVLDTGIGISSDELDHIFDEFHQVDQGTSRPEGLGLGLSIVTRTAELLGCSLEVSSNPGEGSTFSVTVPRGDESSLPSTAVNPEPLTGVTGGWILLVDDEPAIVDATRMLLESEGFDVLTAASAEEAVASINESRQSPDLLLTDYHLRSGETGLNVIDAVRGQLQFRIPAILISGDTSDSVAVTDLECAAFLTKPVAVDDLLAEIHLLIQDS